jgi:hypothetical protein
MTDNGHRLSSLELYDIERKQIITSTPLSEIRFISRSGIRNIPTLDSLVVTFDLGYRP